MSNGPARAADRLARGLRVLAVVGCLAVAAAGVRGWAALYRSAGGASWQRRSLAPVGEPAWWALVGLLALAAAVAAYTARRVSGRHARRTVPLRLEPWLRAWVVVALLALLPPVAAGLALAAYAVTRPPQGGPVVTPTETVAAPAPGLVPQHVPTALVVVVLTGLAAAAGLAAALWAARTTAPPAGPVPVQRPADGLTVALVAAADALRVASDDEPRGAVIGCYAAMERSLRSTAAAPTAADTPTEVLGRAVTEGLLRGPAAARLTELFTEARYSRHPFTVEHQNEAARALRAIRDELSTSARSAV